MNKKSVLIVNIIVIVLLFLIVFVQSGDVCYLRDWCNKLWDTINIIAGMLFVFTISSLFSLITYKMRDEVFEAWWKPARFFIPIIMLVTLLVNSNTRSGGMGISGVIAGGFDIFLIGIFYFIFILTSLIRIISVYRKQ